MSSSRYLGVHMDTSLGWKVHVGSIAPNSNIFTSLWSGAEDHDRAALESITRYGIAACYGSLTVESRSQTAGLVRTAMNSMGVRNHPSFQMPSEQSITRQALNIVSDVTHVLHIEFQLRPSGRKSRVPRSKRYKNSFSLISAVAAVV